MCYYCLYFLCCRIRERSAFFLILCKPFFSPSLFLSEITSLHFYAITGVPVSLPLLLACLVQKTSSKSANEKTSAAVSDAKVFSCVCYLGVYVKRIYGVIFHQMRANVAVHIASTLPESKS